jgi:hypothetical protein
MNKLLRYRWLHSLRLRVLTGCLHLQMSAEMVNAESSSQARVEAWGRGVCNSQESCTTATSLAYARAQMQT